MNVKTLRDEIVELFSIHGWTSVRVKAIAATLKVNAEEIEPMLAGGSRYVLTTRCGGEAWIRDTARQSVFSDTMGIQKQVGARTFPEAVRVERMVVAKPSAARIQPFVRPGPVDDTLTPPARVRAYGMALTNDEWRARKAAAQMKKAEAKQLGLRDHGMITKRLDRGK